MGLPVCTKRRESALIPVCMRFLKKFRLVPWSVGVASVLAWEGHRHFRPSEIPGSDLLAALTLPLL